MPLQNKQCPSCGRDFRGYNDPDLKNGMPCPADDCPSHWEEQGKTYAEELYKIISLQRKEHHASLD